MKKPKKYGKPLYARAEDWVYATRFSRFSCGEGCNKVGAAGWLAGYRARLRDQRKGKGK